MINFSFKNNKLKKQAKEKLIENKDHNLKSYTKPTYNDKNITNNLLINKYRKKTYDIYSDKKETRFLNEKINWIGNAELIYRIALQEVHEKTNGLADFGYIRNIYIWLNQKKFTSINEKIILEAEKDIFTSKDYDNLYKKISSIINTGSVN